LYYIKILNSAGKFIFRQCPRRKSLFEAPGINQEVPGAKKGVPEPMESGAESDGQRVSSCGNRGGKQWKVGRPVMENGSESGGKWVSKQKKGLLNGIISYIKKSEFIPRYLPIAFFKSRKR
jgi:hypothetical protein